MLTLNDGRSELWQWDTGRTLSVPDDCSQVHFSNKVFGRSIDVDVVDGVAIIPDILLQTDKELTAWAFIGTAENGYTKISKVFKVNRRNKPSDYVFTPPEQTTLGEILERLDDLESIQDPDAIKNAVEDYLTANPPKGEKGDKGDPGNDYILTDADKEEIAEMAAELVEIPGSGGNAALSKVQIDALHGMFKVCAYDDSKDVSSAYAAFKTAFGITDSGEEEPDEPIIPDEPDTPEVTLTSISAVYSGGDVAVGTAVVDLAGIVVTAHYSDGSSETVTGYTLSGTIAEGSNTITVTYQGKTATFTVTGVAESGGEGEVTQLAIKNNGDRATTTFYSDEGSTTYVGVTGNSWITEKIAKVDTDVTIRVAWNTSNAALVQDAGCVKHADSRTVYFAERIGYANDSEYSYTYTVKAGYRLCIFNKNSSAPDSLIVTTNRPDDWEDPVNDNLFDGTYVVGMIAGDGSLGSQTLKTTDYMDCSGLSEIYILKPNGDTYQQYYRCYYFYDTSKTAISGDTAGIVPTYPYEAIAVPEGAAYIRVTQGGGYGTPALYVGANIDPDYSIFVAWTTDIS